MNHHLKTLPHFFAEILNGNKPFELRLNDRNFQTGDILILQEWTDASGYTGRELTKQVAFMLDDTSIGKGQLPLSPGWCAMGLKDVFAPTATPWTDAHASGPTVAKYEAVSASDVRDLERLYNATRVALEMYISKLDATQQQRDSIKSELNALRRALREICRELGEKPGEADETDSALAGRAIYAARKAVTRLEYEQRGVAMSQEIHDKKVYCQRLDSICAELNEVAPFFGVEQIDLLADGRNRDYVNARCKEMVKELRDAYLRARSQARNEFNGKSDLPTEPGEYWHADDIDGGKVKMMHVYLAGAKRPENQSLRAWSNPEMTDDARVESIGGYWQKIETPKNEPIPF